MIHTKARPHFDLDLKFGQEKENELQEIFNNKLVEVKTDRVCQKTGNVFVEIEDNGKPSGIMNTKAMMDIRGEEFSPGVDVETDDEILNFIRNTAETAYHPIGTCRMGQGPECVVDERLKVHGLDGLRIADGSIMPTMVSGNTNAACIMIGEKASEMIKQDNAA